MIVGSIGSIGGAYCFWYRYRSKSGAQDAAHLPFERVKGPARPPTARIAYSPWGCARPGMRANRLPVAQLLVKSSFAIRGPEILWSYLRKKIG